MQVDDPAQAEERKQVAGVGVERAKIIAGRDHEDRGAALHLGVGHALPVVLASGGFVAWVVPLPPHPERLPRDGVDGHDRATLPGHVVQTVAHLDGRPPVDEVRLGSVVGRVPAPRDLETARVLGVDLVEGRVAAAPLVPAPVPPLAFLRSLRLGEGGMGEEGRRGGERHGKEGRPEERAFVHGFFLHLMTIFWSASAAAGSSSPPAGMSFRERM